MNGLPRNHRGSARTSRGGPSTRIDPVAMAWPHDSTPLNTPDRAADVHVTINVAVVARVLVAHRRLAAIEHDPHRDPLRRGVVELDDHPAGREGAEVDAMVHPPRQRDRVDAARFHLVVQPVHRPFAEGDDHVLEVLARRRQAVFAAAAGGGRPPFEDPLAFEMLEPLDQQRPGDSRQAAGDVVEPRAAQDQLAQDQRSPPIGDDLGAHRHRTELSVARHDGDRSPHPTRREVHYSYWLGPEIRLVRRTAVRDNDGMTTLTETQDPQAREAELVAWAASFGPVLAEHAARHDADGIVGAGVLRAPPRRRLPRPRRADRARRDGRDDPPDGAW